MPAFDDIRNTEINNLGKRWPDAQAGQKQTPAAPPPVLATSVPPRTSLNVCYDDAGRLLPPRLKPPFPRPQTLEEAQMQVTECEVAISDIELQLASKTSGREGDQYSSSSHEMWRIKAGTAKRSFERQLEASKKFVAGFMRMTQSNSSQSELRLNPAIAVLNQDIDPDDPEDLLRAVYKLFSKYLRSESLPESEQHITKTTKAYIDRHITRKVVD